MKWSKDAESAIKKVPFFIRKKVKKKVEDFVDRKGNTIVSLDDVNNLKSQFLSKGGMENEIKGYDVSVCFGGAGCPNSATSCTALSKDIENIFEGQDLFSFLKTHVKGDLKFHHEFKVVLSDCPNACSRPQIADIGIIGAVLPKISDEPCSLCNACGDTCAENAIAFDQGDETPVINFDQCLMCGKCINTCSTGTLKEGRKGFRVLLGGRLGRHPRLAMELPGLKSHDEVLQIVQICLNFYKKHSKNGRRFSHILASLDQIIH